MAFKSISFVVVLLATLCLLPAYGAITVVRREITSDGAASHHVKGKHPEVVLDVQSSDAPASKAESVAVTPTDEMAFQADKNSIVETPLFRAVALATCMMIGIIVFLYGSKGPLVVMKVLVYIMALSTMKGAVKLVEKSAFEFPLFLTSMHFVSGATVAFTVLLYQTSRSGERISVPSLQTFGSRFGPIALAFCGSISMGNIALVYSTTAFVEIVGASSPIVTVLMTIFMKQPFELKLLGPCFLVFVGCALTTNGEPHFSLLGLFCAVGSNVPRAIKTVLQQLLLQNDPNATNFSPLEVLGWTCVPSCLAMLIWSAGQEGAAPYHQWYQQGFFSSLTFYVLVSCANACILNTAILFVIKDLGAVGTQIIAQTKSILVLLGGACFLKEQVSRLEIVGFVLVMVGVYTYNDLESRFKAKGKAANANTQLRAQVLEDSKAQQDSLAQDAQHESPDRVTSRHWTT